MPSICAICHKPMDIVTEAITWHARCYSSDAFDKHVLPLVIARLETATIPHTSMRDALITELVRQEIEADPMLLQGRVTALQERVAEKFKAMGGVV